METAGLKYKIQCEVDKVPSPPWEGIYHLGVRTCQGNTCRQTHGSNNPLMKKLNSRSFHRNSQVNTELKENEVSPAGAKTISSLKMFTFNKIWMIIDHRNLAGNVPLQPKVFIL